METTILFLAVTIILCVAIVVLYLLLLKSKRKKLSTIYDSLSRLSLKLFLVSKNQKYGVVDLRGNIIVPLEFDKIKLSALPGYFCVAKANFDAPVPCDFRWGIYRDKLLVPCEYGNVKYNKELDGFLTFKTKISDDKGLCSLDGKLIFEVDWLKIERINNNLFHASDNGRYSEDYDEYRFVNYSEVANREGKKIVPKSFNICPFGTLFYAIERRCKDDESYLYRAVYDQNGRIIIPYEYLKTYGLVVSETIKIIGKKHFCLQDSTKRKGDIYDYDGNLKFHIRDRIYWVNGFYCFGTSRCEIVADEDLNVLYTAKHVFNDTKRGYLVIVNPGETLVINRRKRIVFNVEKYQTAFEDNFIIVDHQGKSHLYYKNLRVYSSPYKIVPCKWKNNVFLTGENQDEKRNQYGLKFNN